MCREFLGDSIWLTEHDAPCKKNVNVNILRFNIIFYLFIIRFYTFSLSKENYKNNIWVSDHILDVLVMGIY